MSCTEHDWLPQQQPSIFVAGILTRRWQWTVDFFNETGTRLLE